LRDCDDSKEKRPHVGRLTFSDLLALGTEQNLCYFVACELVELKVSSQVVANVLLSMLGFLDDAISDAFCDLCRVEALKQKIEQDGPQKIASLFRHVSALVRSRCQSFPVPFATPLQSLRRY
jgi:hypothetical protein